MWDSLISCMTRRKLLIGAYTLFNNAVLNTLLHIMDVNAVLNTFIPGRGCGSCGIACEALLQWTFSMHHCSKQYG